MVRIENEPIKKAIATSKMSHRRIAFLAGVAERSIEKLVTGDDNMSVGAIRRLADQFGYDVIVRFSKKPAEAKG